MEGGSMLFVSTKSDHLQIVTHEDPALVCVFCRKYEVDEMNLGPMYIYKDEVVLHYYCMLFSAALSQNGTDQDGVLGFLTEDIMKEVRRSYRLKCSYCQQTGASVGCCNKKCRQVFHFPCGLVNGANYQFHGNYESFCLQHSTVRTCPDTSRNWSCPICMTVITKEDSCIMPSCCKSAVFHKTCLQKMAFNAGYFFKCPTCNSQEVIQEMRSLGIFVPEQDASWEREPDAYQELLYQYSHCDAKICACNKGRDFSANKGHWMMARCRICGAAGTHKLCSRLKSIDDWACECCAEVEKKTDAAKKEAEKLQPPPPPAAVVPGPSQSSAQTNYAETSISPVPEQQAYMWDDNFLLSELVIYGSAYPFFPYNTLTLKNFDKKQYLPDWRSLSLSVNLVNWIGNALKARRSRDDEDLRIDCNSILCENRSVEFPAAEQTCSHNSSESGASDHNKASEENAFKRPLPVKSLNPKNGSKKKRVFRTSGWARGTLSKSKKRRMKELEKSVRRLPSTLCSTSENDVSQETAVSLNENEAEVDESDKIDSRVPSGVLLVPEVQGSVIRFPEIIGNVVRFPKVHNNIINPALRRPTEKVQDGDESNTASTSSVRKSAMDFVLNEKRLFRVPKEEIDDSNVVDNGTVENVLTNQAPNPTATSDQHGPCHESQSNAMASLASEVTSTHQEQNSEQELMDVCDSVDQNDETFTEGKGKIDVFRKTLDILPPHMNGGKVRNVSTRLVETQLNSKPPINNEDASQSEL